MNLQNGKYYTTAKGKPVSAQLEADGDMHCYDVKGNEVHCMAADGHVEGWTPVGVKVFTDARQSAKPKPAKDNKKSAASRFSGTDAPKKKK